MTDPLTWPFWQHWTTSQRPSSLLQTLLQSDQLTLFPELDALRDTPQDPQWHPEGDVWVHTLHVCDQAARISRRDRLNPQQQEELLLAALCHDLGKPSTTVFDQGRWKAPGHPAAGVPVAARFLQQIQAPAQHIATILPLVAEHLIHTSPKLSRQAIRRLLARLHPAPLAQLIRLIEADLGGRPPLPPELPPAVKKFAADALNFAAASPPRIAAPQPTPIILGRHLIALGYQPATWFKQVLNTCAAAQSQGAFQTEQEGLEWLRRLLDAHSPGSPQSLPQPPQ